jgi:ATP-dependent protease ClpP protease subunit
VGTLAIHGPITETTGAVVQAALRDLGSRGARAVVVDVDSTGGDVLQAFAAFEALRSFAADHGPVVVFIADRAASAASVIALAGDFIVMAPQAEVMFHRTSGDPAGCRRADARLLSIYDERTVSGSNALATWFDSGDSRLDVTDALSLGWVDAAGGIEHARSVAGDLAAGYQVFSPRRVALQVRQAG